MQLAPLANYHTHCTYCDGRGTPRDYVDSAIKKGFSALGFSSHAPLSFPADWVMKHADLQNYCDEIRGLREEHRKLLQIYVGLEIDFIPGMKPPFELHPDPDFDFTIGAVHYVRGPQADRWFTVDGPLEELRGGLADFGNDTKALVGAYYDNVRAMLAKRPPAIIGHFDLVRKNNGRAISFDTSQRWYRDEVEETLDAIAPETSLLEVNTGALSRGYADVVYPEQWVLRESRLRGIRVCLNSDSHNPSTIDFAFDRATDMLREAGYRDRWVLLDGIWKSVPIVA